MRDHRSISPLLPPRYHLSLSQEEEEDGKIVGRKRGFMGRCRLESRVCLVGRKHRKAVVILGAKEEFFFFHDLPGKSACDLSPNCSAEFHCGRRENLLRQKILKFSIFRNSLAVCLRCEKGQSPLSNFQKRASPHFPLLECVLILPRKLPTNPFGFKFWPPPPPPASHHCMYASFPPLSS